MLGKLARGMVLFILAALIMVYIFSGDNRPPAPKCRPTRSSATCPPEAPAQPFPAYGILC